MFLHGELAVNLPQFEIDGAKTVLAQRVQDELDNLWKIGRDLDLANWREELDLIQFDSVQSRDGGSDGRSGPVRGRSDRTVPEPSGAQESGLARG